MALSTKGSTLTDAHRRQQIRNADDVASQAVEVATLLDVHDVARTQERMLAAMVPVIRDGASKAQRFAGNYLTVFGMAETGLPIEPVHVAIDEDAALASLRAVGPARAVNLLNRGASPEQARAAVESGLTGVSSRITLDAGRSTIRESVQADPLTVGWARIGRGDTCPFCRMLIGRGEVYSADTARFAAHDKCRCSAEPAYGGQPVTVAQYVATSRNVTEEDKARLRAYLAAQDRPASSAPTARRPITAPKVATPAEVERLNRPAQKKVPPPDWSKVSDEHLNHLLEVLVGNADPNDPNPFSPLNPKSANYSLITQVRAELARRAR